MRLIPPFLGGDGLRARALRGSAFTFFGFGTQQFMRLLSNLVLTRLLFPEAFGLMALVTVVMSGLQLFSDVGIQSAIIRSKRGDDPIFLDTAWTLRIGRGVLLGLITVALAAPLASFYGEPQLVELLMGASLNAVILGFQSTKMSLANRHLVLGRLTGIELASQFVGIFVMIALAWATESVWALVIGVLVSSTVKTILSHFLPGQLNRLAWERGAVHELFHFGKYIFISSAAAFFINSADRAVLGRFIAIGDLGIYSIGFFPASVPILLMRQFGQRILLPLYSQVPPRYGPDNRRKIRMARMMLTTGLVGLGLLIGLIGEAFIGFLYEKRYALAGPIMILLSLSFLPGIVTYAYGNLILSAGNSRRFTVLTVIQAAIQLLLLLWLVPNFGLIGAIATPALVSVLAYPLTAWFAHREGGWDPVLDLGFAVIIVLGSAGILALHDGAIAAVMAR